MNEVWLSFTESYGWLWLTLGILFAPGRKVRVYVEERRRVERVDYPDYTGSYE